MKKLWALKVRGVRTEEKRRACFVSMKVLSSSLIGYSSFPVPKQTLRQRKLNLRTFSPINASKGFDYVCFSELLSTKFQLYNFYYILIAYLIDNV
jgi:hypothetical protein